MAGGSKEVDAATFTKKGYSISEFSGDFVRLFPHLPALCRAHVGPGRLDPRIRERVMLSVSRSNDCRH